MAIIAFNSPKGGVSKTTTAILLGAELALVHKQRVHLLDADLNQHSAAFGVKATIESFTVTPDVTEANILKCLREAEQEADVVLVDLPGAVQTLNLKALQRSDFVIIPCQPSLPDVRDAFKGMMQIEDAAELAGADIPHAILWTRVLPGFESAPARHVRETVEKKGKTLFSTSMLERAAYRAIHLNGKVPRQIDPKSAATANVAAVANEFLSILLASKRAA